jgi:ArsR family transcriptional regulator
MEHYEQASEIMKDLGHPLRMQILEELRREGEACVCHLEARLGQRQAYISQHLARLREARLVIDHREGMNIYYSLADESVGRLLDLAGQVATQVKSIAREPSASRQPHVVDPVLCPCPKCARRRAASLSPLPDQQVTV